MTLDQIAKEAKVLMVTKLQAIAEAREINMRELEGLQRNSKDNDKVYNIYATPDGIRTRPSRTSPVTNPRSLMCSKNSYHSSLQSYENSLEEINSIREVRLRECEKLRKVVVTKTQLNKEKAALAYQVDLFKDKHEDWEEQHLQLLREHKETCRKFEQTKRSKPNCRKI